MKAVLVYGAPIDLAFGLTVRRLRTRKGLTLEMLAEAAGVNRRRIAEIEGGGSAELLEIARLALGLRVTVASLILEFEWSLGGRA